MSLIKTITGGSGRNELASSRSPLATLQNEIDRLFDRVWVGKITAPDEISAWPAIDIQEDERTFTLRADIPGLEAKDLNVEVSGNTLSISGYREEEETEDKNGCCYSERRSGSFDRTVTLPPYVDGSKIDARYEKGVLVVTAPRIAGQGPKRVSVKTS